jgi:hypothetical protein
MTDMAISIGAVVGADDAASRVGVDPGTLLGRAL